jgi:glycosyltransferase involved in cell wall biosynthesis
VKPGITGWLSDMINENNCGVVVTPEDASSFADALIELADNLEKRKVMGINSRLLAEKEFSRDELADKFVRFLEGV